MKQSFQLIALSLPLLFVINNTEDYRWNYALAPGKKNTVRIAIQVKKAEIEFKKTNFAITYFAANHELGYEIQTIGPLRLRRGLHFQDFPAKFANATRLQVSASQAPGYNADLLMSNDNFDHDKDLLAQAAEEEHEASRRARLTPVERQLEDLERDQRVPYECKPGFFADAKMCQDKLLAGTDLPPAAAAAPACESPLSPTELIAQADVIVRAKAVGLKAGSGNGQEQIRLDVLSAIKGVPPVGPLFVDGYFVAATPAQNTAVPYQMARTADLSCYARDYELNREYLLFLKKTPGKDLELYWSAQSPINEPVTGGTDAWVIWVKNSLEKPKAR